MPTKTLQIPTTDGQADAFAAFPDRDERHPGVLLYMDAFGVRPVLEEMARVLAEHGYYVLVPNLYYRHGPAPVIELPEHIGEEIRPAVFAQLLPLIEAHTTERALRDANAYLRFLTTQPEVSAGPVAVIGYCMGGVLAMRTAAAHPDQVAVVAGFHPSALVTDAPDSPHRLVPKLTAQVHLGLAENDMPPEAISELNQALDAAGVGYTCEIYPGTIHGYTMSDTDAFNPSALQRHWWGERRHGDATGPSCCLTLPDWQCRRGGRGRVARARPLPLPLDEFPGRCAGGGEAGRMRGMTETLTIGDRVALYR